MRRSGWWVLAGGFLVAVGLAVAAVFLWLREPWRAEKVVLITIDTLRTHRLGVYGYQAKPTSPNLDAWAPKAVLFENVMAQAPWTVPSLGSVFTGRYPVEVGVYTNRGGISPDIVTLPELFQQQGFRTASFNTHVLLTNRSGGFRRGFDEVFPDKVRPPKRNQHKIPWGNTEPHLMRWLEDHADERFFIWIHSMDTHGPSTVDNPYLSERQWKGYDGEVRWVDEAIGRIIAKLKSVGIRDEILLIFSADHGEAFGEHKLAGHQDVMYDEVLHVPLIIQYPTMGKPSRVGEAVELLDLFPTIAELAGLQVPAGTRGESLVPLIEGRRQRRRTRHLFHSRYYFEDDHHEIAVRDREWKLLVRTPDLNPEPAAGRTKRERQRPKWSVDAPTTTFELYRVSHDPGEKRDLLKQHPEVAARLRQTLMAWRQLVARAPAHPLREAPALDAASLETLRALGYVK